ncbi:MAG: hypothetical protein L0Y66_26415 [Myxococcaceae bacterium]|nr:hypothetical protein [Myxococcaceae bacterium]MCI0672205.1 hypothetical protein [Myxococcaceae bacterium]
MTSPRTDGPDLHALALELFLRMVAADPYREPRRLAEQAYEAARAFLETRERKAVEEACAPVGPS